MVDETNITITITKLSSPKLIMKEITENKDGRKSTTTSTSTPKTTTVKLKPPERNRTPKQAQNRRSKQATGILSTTNSGQGTVVNTGTEYAQSSPQHSCGPVKI